MIEVKDLRMEFGKVQALAGVTFKINPREVVGLLGHNGAGKTTTLRLLLRLLRPTSGTILSTDPDFESNERIGYLEDSPFLFENLTGREMLDYLGCLHGISPRALRRDLNRWIEIFDLGGHLDGLIRTYSRGMKKKLALIGSLIGDPRYWFMDEPTESLDPLAINSLGKVIEESKSHRGILISTHQLNWVEKVVDRVLILQKGVIVFQGSIQSLCEMVGSPKPSLEEVYVRLHEGAADTGKGLGLNRRGLRGQ